MISTNLDKSRVNKMENQELKIRFKKFDGKDFSMWKAKVTNGLRFLGLQNYLTVKHEEDKTPDQTAPGLKALAFVMDVLSVSRVAH